MSAKHDDNAGYPRDTYGLRGYDRARFVEALGRNRDARSTSFGAFDVNVVTDPRVPKGTVVIVDAAIVGALIERAPIAAFKVPTSAYNGRTAKGRARRS